jgi:hypothetical protein
MKKEYQVAAYLTKEEHEKLKSYMSHNYASSTSTYLRKLILNHINTQPLSTPSSTPAVAPNVESSQHLNLSDLDW